MKTFLLLFAFQFIFTSTYSQEVKIETESVSLENLISFIVNNYEGNTASVEAVPKILTFAIQSSSGKTSVEDLTILKQAFKLLSNRLDEQDQIAIISYSGINGIALNQTSSKDLKKILYTLDNFNTSVTEFHKDGIELAYQLAKEHFDPESQNAVVIIRNPHALLSNDANVNTASNLANDTKLPKHAVLLTAITLLPEILAIIKN